MFACTNTHTQAEATQRVQELIEKHREPSVRGRLLLASAGIYASVGDYERAIQTLRDIDNHLGANHFVRSRQMMAAIFLHKYRDHKQYIECHR